MIIFKYLSPAGAAKVLEREGVINLRFGMPSSFNDPYELFLHPDSPLEDRQQVAFYDHMLSDIGMLPVTCFSALPDSMTMWAHYGRERTGVCVGFDDEDLCNEFPIAYLGSVEYSDQLSKVSTYQLQYALATGKPRHAHFFLANAFRTAFFVKRSEWAYEREWRLVVDRTDVEATDDLLVATISGRPVRAIIAGDQVAPPLRELCAMRAAQMDVPFYNLRRGRRTWYPLFVRSDTDEVHRWHQGQFEVIEEVCPECHEPLDETEEGGACTWCTLSDAERREASVANLLSVVRRLGIDAYGVAFAGLTPRGTRATASDADPV